jgi:hypothetical protein
MADGQETFHGNVPRMLPNVIASRDFVWKATGFQLAIFHMGQPPPREREGQGIANRQFARLSARYKSSETIGKGPRKHFVVFLECARYNSIFY